MTISREASKLEYVNIFASDSPSEDDLFHRDQAYGLFEYELEKVCIRMSGQVAMKICQGHDRNLEERSRNGILWGGSLSLSLQEKETVFH